MEEFPEQIARVIVGMACGRSANARVHTNEDADEVRCQGVGEVVSEVGVLAGRSIAGRGTFDFGLFGRRRGVFWLFVWGSL